MCPEILLVEDSPTQALRMQLILERAGGHVTVARNGRQGIEMATAKPPAVVVLDVNLPDLDGFQVCQALKDNPATAHVLIIMLTVKDRVADTLAGLDAGADAYIPKDDFAEENLRAALRDLQVL